MCVARASEKISEYFVVDGTSMDVLR